MSEHFSCNHTHVTYELITVADKLQSQNWRLIQMRTGKCEMWLHLIFPSCRTLGIGFAIIIKGCFTDVKVPLELQALWEIYFATLRNIKLAVADTISM